MIHLLNSCHCFDPPLLNPIFVYVTFRDSRFIKKGRNVRDWNFLFREYVYIYEKGEICGLLNVGKFISFQILRKLSQIFNSHIYLSTFRVSFYIHPKFAINSQNSYAVKLMECSKIHLTDAYLSARIANIRQTVCSSSTSIKWLHAYTKCWKKSILVTETIEVALYNCIGKIQYRLWNLRIREKSFWSYTLCHSVHL